MVDLTNSESEFNDSDDTSPFTDEELAKVKQFSSSLVSTRENTKVPASPENDGDAEDTGLGVVPAPTNPMDVAKVILDRWNRVRFIKERGVERTISWRDDWYDYNGTCYQYATNGSIQNALRRSLAGAYYTQRDDDGNVKCLPWNPTNAKINELESALKALTEVESAVDDGSWLVFPENPKFAAHADDNFTRRLIACSNVLLDPKTGETFSHDDRYLTTFSLPFEYSDKAECPQWEEFLEKVFPSDDESKFLLQEWFGYVLSGRTDMQKMMIFKGAPRSGKGTIARILSALLSDNVAAPSLEDFAGVGFNLSTFLGRPLITVGDARNALKPKEMQSAISRMLSITGEDSVKIERKYKEAWTGKLPGRIMILGNEHLDFKDSSGAIIGRSLMLIFTVGNEGREDQTLEPRLRTELPGILNWAVKGYKRLEKNGVFTRPEASEKDRGELSTIASPVRAWLNATCERGSESDTVMSGHMHELFVEWHEQQDVQGEPVHKNRMLQQIKTIAEWAHVGKKPNVPCHCLACNGKRSMAWTGIKYVGRD